jgi:putative PIN family toxin of toxin-antitoxin system
MRAVIDTNVLLSALLWSGPPHALLDQVRNGAVTLVSSPALLAELTTVIARPKFEGILVKSNTSRAKRWPRYGCWPR